MIFTAQLGSAVKKSQSDKAFITSVDKICASMPLDPKVSTMDAVILGPKDVMGVNSAKIQQAINVKHPGVCVIYLYTKEQEKGFIQCEYSKMYKRLDDKAITEAVNEFLSDHLVRAGRLEVESKDLQINGPATEVIKREKEIHSASVEEPAKQEPQEVLTIKPGVTDVVTGITTIPEEPTPVQEEEHEEELCITEESVPEVAPVIQEQPEYIPANDTATNQQMEAIAEFKDFDLLKKALEKDKIIAEVLAENADYKQVSQMLDVLDQNIKTVFIDSSLSPEERYERIKDIGMQRSALKGKANEMIIKKTKSIFDKITSVVDTYVDKRVSEMEKALTKITLDKAVIESGGINIEQLIEERTKMEVELMELMRNVIDVYKSMTTITSDELSELDTNLPSTNQFVNGTMAHQRGLFTPQNTGALCTELCEALQTQRITMSALENRIKQVINVIFAICEKNDMIIQYQANLIKLLRANKVEDVVVVDTMLKGVLRLYVAAPDTGATATILTQSGLQARTANTLIVDLSGNSKWEDYGVTPHTWDDFVVERPHENLCVVTCNNPDPEKIHAMIVELKKFLDYYQFINIKLDCTQVDAVSQLCDDAIVIHVLSDCRVSNIKSLKPAVSAVWTKNIAKKLILVDAPTDDILNVAKELGCDVTTTKVISIPHITEMKGCAISRKLPYQNKIIADIFEGAFR